MTEDEMVGWHHQLYGHEFEQAPGDGDDLALRLLASRTEIINLRHSSRSACSTLPQQPRQTNRSDSSKTQS